MASSSAEDDVRIVDDSADSGQEEGRDRVMTAPDPKLDWARPVGRNSEIWDHFSECVSDRDAKKEKIRVRCNYCPAMFTYCSSTTNFWRHTRKEHPGKLSKKKEGSGGDSDAGPSSKSQPLISTVFVKIAKETRAMVSWDP